MTKAAQKSEERFYIDQFLEKAPGHWEYIAQCQPSAPDFLVADWRGVLGVEVTSVQKDALEPDARSKHMEAESLRRNFLWRAAEHYYAHGGLPIMVHAEKAPPPGYNLDDLTRRLKATRPSQDWADAQFEICPNDDPDLLPIAEFRVTALPAAKLPGYSYWQSVESMGGWVRFVGPEDLEWRVSEKAAKLPGYRSVVRRVALLLYADRTRTSGLIEWPNGGRLSTTHGFDEVHLFLHPYAPVRIA